VSLLGAIEAAEQLIVPILIGPKAKIRVRRAGATRYLAYEIISTEHSEPPLSFR